MRSPQRVEYLTDVLVTAVENFGYGWFAVEKYECDGSDPYAVVHDETDDEPIEKYRIDLDVIAKGLGVIRTASLQVSKSWPDDGPVLHNVRSGHRLYMSPSVRTLILESSRKNDASVIDTGDALAIVECGLFGFVKFN